MVVIIGILAASAIPKFANTKEKVYVASLKSDLRNLAVAQEAYFADEQRRKDVADPTRKRKDVDDRSKGSWIQNPFTSHRRLFFFL